ncbi:MAG: rod shape-determining protein MreC [Methylococcales bacterium]|nr:rod shape-determining protein MreC [Methylococcales bacterium]
MAIKLLFAKGPSLHTRFIIAVLFSVLLLAMDHKSSRLEGIRSFLSVVVHPVQFLVSLPLAITNQTFQLFVSYKTLKEENNALKQEVNVRTAGLMKLQTLEKDNIRLRAFMHKSQEIAEEVLPAELIRATHFPYKHVILVDKGTPLGVKKQQLVLDTNGVVGQVVRVHPLSAEVMLITDPSHGIAVEISRNGLRTVAFGSGIYNQLNLPFLPNDADVREGDLLITSGLDGTFARGYPVARIKTIQEDQSKPLADIMAEPIAQLDKIRDILIITSKPKIIELTDSEVTEKIPTESDDHTNGVKKRN